MTEVGVEPTQNRPSTCWLCRLAYPVEQSRSGVGPRCGASEARKRRSIRNSWSSGDGGIRTHTVHVLSVATPAGLVYITVDRPYSKAIRIEIFNNHWAKLVDITVSPITLRFLFSSTGGS